MTQQENLLTLSHLGNNQKQDLQAFLEVIIR